MCLVSSVALCQAFMHDKTGFYVTRCLLVSVFRPLVDVH